MLARLRLAVTRRRTKNSDRSIDVPYPTLNRSERFCDPHAPLGTGVVVAELVQQLPLSQEDQDALIARQLEQRENDEQAQDERIARDLAAAERAQVDREQQEAERLARELESELFDEDLRRTNGVLECPVCLGEFYRGETMIQCQEGHVLCQECAVQGARIAFEQLNASLSCLASGDCTSHYPPEQAKLFLDPAAYARWEQLLRDSDIATLANDPSLKRCPYCPYAVILEDPTAATMDCLNPDCAKSSCLLCQHPPHPNVPCAAANPTSAFLRLAEAMSAEMLRQCPKCRKPFVRTTGCCLITCSDTKCKAKSCYLCKALLLDGYGHFDKPGKGLLFAKDDVVLARVKAIRDQGLAALDTDEERFVAQRLNVG